MSEFSRSTELEDKRDELVSEYRYHEWPWISKSKIKALRYCDFNFYDEYFAPKKESKHLGVKPIVGTNTHLVMSLYFKYFDPTVGFRYISTDTPVKQHPFKRYVYDICMGLIPAKERDYSIYKYIYSNFAEVETKHWLYLNGIPDFTKNQILKTYIPKVNEEFIDDPLLFNYGTLDRVSEMDDGKGNIIDYIFDYKTGNVPNSIKEGTKHNDPFSWKLPSRFSTEMHFYCLLYLRKQGCTPSEEVVDFLTKPEFLTVKENDDDWKIHRKEKRDYLKTIDCTLYYPDGEEVKNGDLGFRIMFFGDKEPYVPIKKFKYNSLRSTYVWINITRSIWLHKRFVTRPKYVVQRCQHCSKEKRCRETLQEAFNGVH